MHTPSAMAELVLGFIRFKLLNVNDTIHILTLKQLYQKTWSAWKVNPCESLKLANDDVIVCYSTNNYNSWKHLGA